MAISRLVKEKKLPLPLIRFLLNISVAIFQLETQQTRRSILPTPYSIYVSIFLLFLFYWLVQWVLPQNTLAFYTL